MSAQSEKQFFAVVRVNGAEYPCLYYDHLPAWMTGKRAASEGLLYLVRLDTLPNGHRFTSMDLTELLAIYRRLRDAGRLPASNL